MDAEAALIAMENDPQYRRLSTQLNELYEKIQWKPIVWWALGIVFFLILLNQFFPDQSGRNFLITIVVMNFDFLLTLLLMFGSLITGFLVRFWLLKLLIGITIGLGYLLSLSAQTFDSTAILDKVSPISVDGTRFIVGNPIRIGPFEPGAVSSTLAEKKINRLVNCIERKGDKRPIWLILVGSTDRQLLGTRLKAQYGTNRELGVTRARWVEDRMRSHLPSLPNASIFFGGLNIEATTAAEMQNDRFVTVQVVYEDGN